MHVHARACTHTMLTNSCNHVHTHTQSLTYTFVITHILFLTLGVHTYSYICAHSFITLTHNSKGVRVGRERKGVRERGGVVVSYLKGEGRMAL